MRTPIYLLVAALLVGGCTHYHVTPAGSPSPDRVPERDRPEPLELDIGRPHGSQLPIQTSRPAYVAIFEIVPNRGVTLIYPAAVHQQNMLVSGLTWVPLWWSPKRVSFNSDRYIYAVASDEPLKLSGETFAGGYFSRVLGLPIYRAERPYSTMRAISNAVVPDVQPEEWAEDVHVLTPTYHTEVYRTVKIYCAGGRVFDVPEDMVSRVWCPTRTRVVIVDGRPRSREYPVGRPARPDSVYGQGGTRVRIEPTRPRGPIARVVDPDDRDRGDRGRGRGRDARDERDDRDDRDKDAEKPRKGRGRLSDLFNEATDEAKEREKAEREREKEERERQRREAKEERERERREAEEARRREAEERKDERDERKDARDERKDERREERDERKDERQDARDERKGDDRRDEPKQQGQPREEKREEKREEQQEEKRAEPRQEKQEKKGRGSISDMIKEAKEKEKQNKP